MCIAGIPGLSGDDFVSITTALKQLGAVEATPQGKVGTVEAKAPSKPVAPESKSQDKQIAADASPREDKNPAAEAKAQGKADRVAEAKSRSGSASSSSVETVKPKGKQAAVEAKPQGKLGTVCRKTRMCKFYSAGKCAKGSACNFAHDEAELKPLPDLARTKVCPAFASTGHCGNPRCHFAHGREELRRVRLPFLQAAPYETRQLQPQSNARSPLSTPTPSRQTTSSLETCSLPFELEPLSQDSSPLSAGSFVGQPRADFAVAGDDSAATSAAATTTGLQEAKRKAAATLAPPTPTSAALTPEALRWIHPALSPQALTPMAPATATPGAPTPADSTSAAPAPAAPFTAPREPEETPAGAAATSPAAEHARLVEEARPADEARPAEEARVAEKADLHAGAADCVKAPARKARFQKTKMCSFYGTGKCLKGEDCNFAHSPEELKVDTRAVRACAKMDQLPTLQRARSDEELSAQLQPELRPVQMPVGVQAMPAGDGGPTLPAPVVRAVWAAAMPSHVPVVMQVMTFGDGAPVPPVPVSQVPMAVQVLPTANVAPAPRQGVAAAAVPAQLPVAVQVIVAAPAAAPLPPSVPTLLPTCMVSRQSCMDPSQLPEFPQSPWAETPQGAVARSDPFCMASVAATVEEVPGLPPRPATRVSSEQPQWEPDEWSDSEIGDF